MRKLPPKLGTILVIVALILPWIAATTALAADPTPTPPPPPSKPTATDKPKPKPPNKTKTPTPTKKPSGPWYTATPSPTATLEETLTPTVTLTITPTATMTPTATPIPTYLEILVYMDTNENRQFDMGEGVEDLIVVATSATWQSWVKTSAGKVTFLLPPTMAKDTAIDVEVPYLHWSLVVKAPDTGGIAKGELQLALPEYPVFLP